MTTRLTLYEDSLSPGGALARSGHALRALYVVAGSLIVPGATAAADDGGIVDGGDTVHAGAAGARVWRFELHREAAPSGTARVLLDTPLPPLPGEDETRLLRLDSVAFPPGGCALLHTHQGPGIRCLLEGSIRIDTEGHSTDYGPGGAWFEAGPDPVFAAADETVPSRFIRAMVLPGKLLGLSSIHYVREADRTAPKSQRYRVYDERLLDDHLAGP